MIEVERACAIVAAKDASPLRVALFRRLATHRPLLRTVLASWDRVGGTPVGTAMVAALGAKCFGEVRFPTSGAPLLSVGKYRNEERQFATLQARVPDIAIDHIGLDPGVLLTPDGWSSLPVSASQLIAAWHLIDRYARQSDFLVAARVASTVGYALRMRLDLPKHPARAVLVSSDANPYAVALLAAAREHGRRTCFVTHGHVADGPPALDVDLAILDGAAVRDVYARVGPLNGQVVLRGSEGQARSMDTTGLRAGCRTLGVFMSILADWPQVARTVAQLRAVFQPEQVILRMHPNLAMRDPRWAEHFDGHDVQISDGSRALTDDAAACDLVAIGASSAHLTVLKYGVPTVQMSDLDQMEPDYYGFVAGGIVCDAPDPDVLASFYDDRDWPARFARFDASYPDNQQTCDVAVAAALQGLVEARA